MSVSSYGDATESSGVVRITKDLEESIEGKHVIIVEDIIDTGLTLNYLLKNLHSRNPASLRICTLLDKPDNRRVEIPIDYVGFKVPNDFLVGYGLTSKLYRNIPMSSFPRKSLSRTDPKTGLALVQGIVLHYLIFPNHPASGYSEAPR